ncbi:MAG: ferritin-like domain-containing protein, partial [Proteobacteria bacterium]|nr:ferritin-like domain-containing protein [Pseudomonadota bacterium]
RPCAVDRRLHDALAVLSRLPGERHQEDRVLRGQPDEDQQAHLGEDVQADVTQPKSKHRPFASETNFLLGAYVLEDVCVSALCGAAPRIASKVHPCVRRLHSGHGGLSGRHDPDPPAAH